MNRPSQVIRPRISSQQAAVGEKGGVGYTRSVGRNFIMALYGSLRSIRMYPIENPVVQKGRNSPPSRRSCATPRATSSSACPASSSS